MLDWMLDKHLSLSDAFKLLDSDFDGTISLRDFQIFLESIMKVDL